MAKLIITLENALVFNLREILNKSWWLPQFSQSKGWMQSNLTCTLWWL